MDGVEISMSEEVVKEMLVELPFDSNAVIEFINVYKNYKNVQALRGISFSIHKGDIFGFIGPNGAGKTTALKILVGLISDYSGDLRVNSELLANHANLGSIIGYMPQEVGFQEWRTVD